MCRNVVRRDQGAVSTFSTWGVPMETRGTPKKSSSSAPQTGEDACVRCGGLLRTQQYMDLLDDTGISTLRPGFHNVWRKVIDPVYFKESPKSAAQLAVRTKARKFSQRVTADSEKKHPHPTADDAETDEEHEASSDDSGR